MVAHTPVDNYMSMNMWAALVAMDLNKYINVNMRTWDLEGDAMVGY